MRTTFVCGAVVALLLVSAACTSGTTLPGRATTSTSSTSASSTQTTVPSPTSPQPSQPVAGCAQTSLDGLDLAHRVGQLLMIGVPLSDPVTGYAEVEPYAVGGVFLAGRSSAGVNAIASDVAQIRQQNTGLALQIGVDQEGGQVQTLRGPGFTDIPTAVTQSRLELPDLATQTTSWGAELAAAGITLNLAPVADVVPPSIGTSNPPIGAFDRQYGSDPTNAALNVQTVVSALESAGIQTTLKHFPGLGRVTANTDTSTQAVDTMTTAFDPSLQPFVAGITAGSAAVMISSARYPQLDPDNIAAFSSPIITDLLRGRLGFTGVVISDDLGQAVAVAAVPTGQRAVDFIAAGGDVVLSVVTADAAPMSAALLAKATADPGFAATVDAAALRVLTAKQDAGLLTCG